MLPRRYVDPSLYPELHVLISLQHLFDFYQSDSVGQFSKLMHF